MTRNLYKDYLEGRPELSGFYALAPGEWERAAEARRRAQAPAWRAEDLAELRAFNADCGAPALVLENIAKLAKPETLVVITGQQAGLALGPLYTLYKAIGAILHAREASKRLGAEVVPCFWIAAEDHDFEEVREVSWLTKDGDRATFRYEPENGADGFASVGELSLEPSLEDLIARLEETTLPTEFRADVLAWLGDALRKGVNWEGCFARLLMRLLGEHGLVMLTPRLMGLRRHAAELFRREMQSPGLGSRLAMESAAELTSLGYEPALYRRPEDLNFYFQENGERLKLTWASHRVERTRGNEVVFSESAEACLRRVEADPRAISTAAAMRPLTQDSALNTIAYIAGPGEIAYFAQLRPLYQTFGVNMPIIQPRPSAMLIDARTRRFLEKSGVTLEQLKAMNSSSEAASGALAALAARGAGGDWAAYESGRDSIASALSSLKSALSKATPAVSKAIEKLEASQTTGLDMLRQRLEAELASRDGAMKSQAEKVEAWLWPNGEPQERVYSALAPLLVNYGFGAVERLIAAIDLKSSETQWFEL